MVNYWLRTMENAPSKALCGLKGHLVFPGKPTCTNEKASFGLYMYSGWSANWPNLQVASLCKRFKMASPLKKLRVLNFNKTWGLQYMLVFMCIKYFYISEMQLIKDLIANLFHWKWFLCLLFWLIREDITCERAKHCRYSKKWWSNTQ